MSRTYANDRRERALNAVEGGTSARSFAALLGIGLPRQSSGSDVRVRPASTTSLRFPEGGAHHTAAEIAGGPRRLSIRFTTPWKTERSNAASANWNTA